MNVIIFPAIDPSKEVLPPPYQVYYEEEPITGNDELGKSSGPTERREAGECSAMPVAIADKPSKIKRGRPRGKESATGTSTTVARSKKSTGKGMLGDSTRSVKRRETGECSKFPPMKPDLSSKKRGRPLGKKSASACTPLALVDSDAGTVVGGGTATGKGMPGDSTPSAKRKGTGERSKVRKHKLKNQKTNEPSENKLGRPRGRPLGNKSGSASKPNKPVKDDAGTSTVA